MQREDERNAAQEREFRRHQAERARKEQEEVDRMMALFAEGATLPPEILAQQVAAEAAVLARNGQPVVKALPRVDDAPASEVKEQAEDGVRAPEPAVVRQAIDATGPEQQAILAKLEQTSDFQRRKAEREEKEAAELKQAMDLLAAMENQVQGDNGAAVAVPPEILAQQADAVARCEHAKALQAAARAAREQAELDMALRLSAQTQVPKLDSKEKEESDQFSALSKEQRDAQENALASFKQPSHEDIAAQIAKREDAILARKLALVIEASEADARVRDLRADPLAKLASTSVEKNTQASEEPTVRMILSDQAKALELKPQTPVATSVPGVGQQPATPPVEANAKSEAELERERVRALRAKRFAPPKGNNASS